MKKSILFFSLFLTTAIGNAQSIYTTDASLTSNRLVTMAGYNLNFSTVGGSLFVNGTTGNVGIGNTVPTTKLDVSGAFKANQAIISSSLADGQTFSSFLDRNDKSAVVSMGRTLGTGPGYTNSRMFNFFDFPVSNLDANSSFLFSIEDRSDYGRFRMTGETGGTTNLMVLDKTQTEIFKVNDDGNNNTVLSLPKTNSYLCIGTINYTDGAELYKLSVKGKVRAEEVKVYTTWADYVFNKNYNLKPLNEVESFIDSNGHLPNVPSGNEIEKDGLKLGEMAKIQQEKIEELTLYLIQQNKEIQELKVQMKKMLEKK